MQDTMGRNLTVTLSICNHSNHILVNIAKPIKAISNINKGIYDVMTNLKRVELWESSFLELQVQLAVLHV